MADAMVGNMVKWELGSKWAGPILLMVDGKKIQEKSRDSAHAKEHALHTAYIARCLSAGRGVPTPGPGNTTRAGKIK